MGIILDLLSVREIFSEAYNSLLDLLSAIVLPDLDLENLLEDEDV